MHPRRLTSCKTLLLIFLHQALVLLPATHQSSLLKRGARDLNSAERTPDAQQYLSSSSSHGSLVDSPFMVLMSEDTISLAHMPMILYGNLTDVYLLDPSDLTPSRDDLDLRERAAEKHEAESEDDADGADLEIEHEDSRGRKKRTTSAIADARESEQMPQITSASLGKSEWQQIALDGRARAGAFARATQSAVRAANRKEAQEEEEEQEGGDVMAGLGGQQHQEGEAATAAAEGFTGGRLGGEAARGRRRRRSNSASDYDDDSSRSASTTGAHEKENSTASSGAPTSRSRGGGGGTVEESGDVQNVTSARADTGPQHGESLHGPNSEPPPPARHDGSAPAEDDDRAGPLPCPSSPAAAQQATTSTGPSGAVRQAPSVGRVRFTDFDVHMALGYAFVADSAGRIHRFKLPIGPRASSSSSSPAPLSSGHTGAIVGENVLAENDATAANTIDVAGSKFAYGPGLAHTSRRQQEANFSAANRAADDDAYANSIMGKATNLLQSTTLDGASKGSSGGGTMRARDAAAHEQSENERQHPSLVSGEQNAVPDSAGSPVVSGIGAQQARRSGVGRSENLVLDGAKQGVIWSRGRPALRVGGGGPLAQIGASSAKQRERQILAASDGGRALPADARDCNHQSSSADERQATTSGGDNERHSSTRADADGAQRRAHAPHGSGDERRRAAASERQQSSCTSRERTRQSTQLLRTEVAVDWLNNLLFVLDKCRLLVMDLDGNNELLLIDDFNANNRPIDIKVDPRNDFLFWLQVGKFHNTIYKLDLSVLSMPQSVASTQRLTSAGTLRLHQQQHNSRASALANDSATSASNADARDSPVPFVSHHYAHPIITNLPRHAKIFTIDHRHSQIYVPLGLPPPPASSSARSEPGSSADSASEMVRDDAEVFAPAGSDVTHLNSTSFSSGDEATNCGRTEGAAEPALEGQILAYNLDGTDVGPLRSGAQSSHIGGLEDIQDLTLDAGERLLYWLTNSGRDLLEEFKENSTIQPAQHNLNGKSYIKLFYFNAAVNSTSQPTSQRPPVNVRKIMNLLSSAAISASYRPTRSDGVELTNSAALDEDYARSLRFRASEVDASSLRHSQSAPYIILGATCVAVLTVYLVYALVFQRIHWNADSEHDSHCRARSNLGSSLSGGGGGSSDGGDSHIDTNSNRFVNSTTIAKWIASPAAHCDNQDARAFSRNATNSFNEYDFSSTNYDATNAVDAHYGDDAAHHGAQMFDVSAASCLANLSRWPTNMHDLSNKQYVPIESTSNKQYVLQDDELNKIRRFSLGQLEIEERKEPLGKGHFATVLQGTIRCTRDEKYLLLENSMTAGNGAISPDSLASPSTRNKLFAPSTVSSGHGSSSSTSCEFVTANTLTEPTTSNDDYLTPKTQLNSTSSDYSVDVLAGSSRGASCSGYRNTTQLARGSIHSSGAAVTEFRVAIKRLNDENRAHQRDFLQEAKLLASFDHPNIIHLIGICLDGGSTLIIMELALGGDLIRYMQANTPKDTGDNIDNLTYDDLLEICLDIANGCCYLEGQQHVHRDLAARNCLVSSRKREERVVKLADFGLARNIYGDSYYKKVNDSEMPLKWMAPECLTEQKFSHKSDVWSFGIVMWEVMGYCQEKPHDKVAVQLLRIVLSDSEKAKLKKPEGCDDCMYKLMEQCWQIDPEKRPSFHECRAMLIELKNKQSSK